MYQIDNTIQSLRADYSKFAESNKLWREFAKVELYGSLDEKSS